MKILVFRYFESDFSNIKKAIKLDHVKKSIRIFFSRPKKKLLFADIYKNCFFPHDF